MKILTRYYLKEFFRYLAASLAILASIFMLLEFIGEINDIYEDKPAITLVLIYFALRVPRFILFVLPMASLFSTLLTIGFASKWKEMVAIKSAGGGVKKVFSPFIVVGIGLTLLSLLLSESLVPWATTEAKELRYSKMQHRRVKVMFKDGELWLRGTEGSLIYIRNFAYYEGMAYQVSTFRFEDDFVLKDIIEAQNARWNKERKRWELNNVKIFNTEDNKIVDNKIVHYNSLPFEILEPPETLVKEIKAPEEMNILELYRYYEKIRESGYHNVKYEVDLYGKLTFPIMNFVMIMFGLSLSLQDMIRSGILAMGIGVIVIILYWVFYSVTMMLGYAELLPPWLAPWISPVLFGAGGTFLFKHLKE